MIDEYIISNTQYAGAGGGAFSYLDDRMITNVFSVPNYIQLLESGGSPALYQKRFTEGEKIRYHLLLQLFSGRFSRKEILSQASSRTYLLSHLLLLLLFLSGTVKWKRRGLEMSDKGAYRSLLLMKHFFQGISRLREACRVIDKPSRLVDQYRLDE